MTGLPDGFSGVAIAFAKAGSILFVLSMALGFASSVSRFFIPAIAAGFLSNVSIS